MTHRQALAHRDVAAAIEAVRSGSAQPAVKLAFEFLVLTATRSGEARGAQWTEIDTTDHVWTLSAQQMKAKREHRVPLCGRALEILDEARALGDGNPLVHPREVIEAALAHVVQNKVEAVYARSDLFDRRRQLMADWAAYLDGERRPSGGPDHG
ncbi:MAG: tyrosine-type recombinase/integrase [Gammaproteobacteria bacterium]|nr:tyrosine-type recombinase/integrase [Gammaproteobacteria bacterium]